MLCDDFISDNFNSYNIEYGGSVFADDYYYESSYVGGTTNNCTGYFHSGSVACNNNQPWTSTTIKATCVAQ